MLSSLFSLYVRGLCLCPFCGTRYAQTQLARQQIHKLRAARAHTQAEAEATIITVEMVNTRLTLDR